MRQPSLSIILRSELAEYRRPWKISTFLFGLSLLIWGALTKQAPDWDIPICFIMAIPTYLTAPLTLRIIFEQRWQLFPLALISTWLSVDGFYWLYWNFRNPHILQAMRWGNFPASLSLYGLCGMLWLFRGSLREFYDGFASLFHSKKKTPPQ